VDRLEALAKDPAATQTQIHAALQYKNQAQLAFNGARGAVLDAAHQTDFLTTVQEVAQEVQDAIHGVTGSAADWIEETGAPAPLVAAATLPLHIVDSVVDLDAGIVKGAAGLVQGVAGMVAHPADTATGAFTLFDQAAQTTLAAQAVQFLGEAAFGKFDSLDEAVQDWNERSDPLKLAQAQWDFTTDVGKAMLSESIEAWKEGKYSEAVGVFVGQNVDILLGAGILKSGRLGGITRVVDGASDAQRVVGATTKAGRALDATGDVARTANVATDAGKAADALTDATRGARTPGPAAAAHTPEAAKAAASGTGVEGTRSAGAVDTLGAQRMSSRRPQWLDDVERGTNFEKAHAFDYPHREVYIERPGGRYYRLDAYDPFSGEIVSWKNTNFSQISERTAIDYLDELARKYPPNARIAKVPSSGPLAGQRLRGQMILEVPLQTRPIPKAVLDHAKAKRIVIRDVYGNVYS
jgi:hypothetical protein